MYGTLKFILFLATLATIFSGLLVIEAIDVWNGQYMTVGVLGLGISAIAFTYVGKMFELPS